MKTMIKTIALIATMMFFFTACRSDDNTNNSTATSTTAGFTWRENSTTAPVKTAGSSEVRTQYKSIFAFTGTTATSGTLFEFNLTGVSPATYTIGGSNAFYFSGNTATPASGEVVITSNANGKASGTFKATWSNGTITSVYGTFTDIPVK